MTPLSNIRAYRSAGLLPALLAAVVVGVACSSPPDTVATIDGIHIERHRLEALHPAEYELVPDETASSLLLLMIHDVFIAAAEADLGITVPRELADSAFAARTQSAGNIGELDAVLANRGETVRRVRLEADLDALRELVGPALVRREVDGFDIDAAYESYLLEEAHVCVRQIQLDSTADIGMIIERANGGESFSALAREFSTDRLAQRPEGESGAGGDMGCSYPNAFGLGLAQAALDTAIPVGEAFGPVIGSRGLHVMVVYEREIANLADVRQAVIAAAEGVQGPDLFIQWGLEILRQADVSIHENYGTWEPAPGTNGVPTVVPPEQD